MGNAPIFVFSRSMHERARKVKALIEPAVNRLGYELLGVECRRAPRRSLLRVYIDSENGIGVADCERVSYQVSGVLDVENPLPGAYDLEVSSPGLDRPLFEPRHFNRYRGATVKIRLTLPIEGRRHIRGILAGCRDGSILINVDGAEHALPLDSVGTARIVPEF